MGNVQLFLMLKVVAVALCGGEGICGDGEGTCGDGDGICGDGEGIGEGTGTCGDGEGICGDGEGTGRTRNVPSAPIEAVHVHG